MGITGSPYIAKSMHQDWIVFHAQYLGNSTSDLKLDKIDHATTFRDNYDVHAKGTATLATGSHKATGIYVVTFKEFPPTVLDVISTIRNPSGTSHRIQTIGWNTNALGGASITIDSQSVPPMSVIFKVTDLGASDAAVDAATTDAIRLMVIGRLSTNH